MSTNDFITIPTRDEALTLCRQKVALSVTAFAKHAGLATGSAVDPNTMTATAFDSLWLRNKGDQRDTAMVYRHDRQGRYAFATEPVTDPTVGVTPLLQNHDHQPFGLGIAPDGQTVIIMGDRLPRYPQSPVTPEEAADLDHVLASDNKMGFRQVGTFTAPDTGRQMPCYRYRGQFYAQHTNRAGHSAWFHCDPIAVRPLDGDRLLAKAALFAAPLSNQQKFRERTQGVMTGDAINLSPLPLGRFLADTFLPELIKSTTFNLTHPVDKIFIGTGKLSRLNVTLRNTEQDNTQER